MSPLTYTRTTRSWPGGRFQRVAAILGDPALTVRSRGLGPGAGTGALRLRARDRGLHSGGPRRYGYYSRLLHRERWCGRPTRRRTTSRSSSRSERCTSSMMQAARGSPPRRLAGAPPRCADWHGTESWCGCRNLQKLVEPLCARSSRCRESFGGTRAVALILDGRFRPTNPTSAWSGSCCYAMFPMKMRQVTHSSLYVPAR